MPDLVGLGLDAANAQICAAGLTPAQATIIGGSERNLPIAEINRRLKVVASTPGAGAVVPRGAPVSVTLRSPAAEALVFTRASCTSVSAPPPWTIDLADVALGPDGVGMAMHPTTAPIAVSVDSELPLQVCPADATGRPSDPALSSFGRRWTECRPLGAGVVELPVTDGRSHVGFTIRRSGGGTATVARLRVRWACQDDYFAWRDPDRADPGADAGLPRRGLEEGRVPLQQILVAPGPLALGDDRLVARLLLQPAEGLQDLTTALLADPLLLLGAAGGTAIRAVVVGEEGRRRHPTKGSGRGPAPEVTAVATGGEGRRGIP